MNTTMKYASLDFGTVEAVFNKLGGLEGAAQFLRDELTLVLQPKPEPPLEPALDFLVRVDRSVKPSYPNWFKKLEHPSWSGRVLPNTTSRRAFTSGSIKTRSVASCWARPSTSTCRKATLSPPA